MEISNKTNRPLRVPLPGGKKLHLAANGKAKITPKAAEHPAVLKLIEEETVTIIHRGRGRGTKDASGSAGVGGSQRGPASGGMRHTGDR
ncbi:MAG: hypothetical protein P1V35_10620 [Planctomycetota bacterium]|nr:hypothetical protein [Planctomycetota bacterium]